MRTEELGAVDWRQGMVRGWVQRRDMAREPETGSWVASMAAGCEWRAAGGGGMVQCTSQRRLWELGGRGIEK